MKKENLKHIVLIVTAICLIGIGYLNYDYEPTVEVASLENQVDETTFKLLDLTITLAVLLLTKITTSSKFLFLIKFSAIT